MMRTVSVRVIQRNTLAVAVQRSTSATILQFAPGGIPRSDPARSARKASFRPAIRTA